jgi:hypothetical protein
MDSLQCLLYLFSEFYIGIAGREQRERVNYRYNNPFELIDNQLLLEMIR